MEGNERIVEGFKRMGGNERMQVEGFKIIWEGMKRWWKY